MSNNKKIILYLDGGAMSGVFCAGVLTTFQDLNIYSHIEAVYAASAGAFNAPYFLTRQSRLGSSIYWENLTKDFILPRNLPLGILQRIFYKRIPKDRIKNVIDVDYLLKIAKNVKPLDTEKIGQIPFYIKVLNIKTSQNKYILADSRNIFDLLKTSICVAPYTFESTLINKEHYIDGTIREPIGLKYLLDKYPDKRIVIVSNRRGDSKFRHKIKSFFEGIMAWLMYGKGFYKMFMERDKLADNDIWLAKNNKNVLLIYASDDCPVRPSTTNGKKLEIAYEMGRKAGLGIKDFLGI